MNVRFEYLYRDAGNFKNWGNVVFSSLENEAVEDLTQRLRSHLIDGSFFIAKKAAVPDLHFDKFDEDLDHGWHEFASLEYVSVPPTDIKDRGIEQFLLDLKSAC